MKNSKAVIAVLCAIVLIFSLAACAQQKAKMEKVAQVVAKAVADEARASGISKL